MPAQLASAVIVWYQYSTGPIPAKCQYSTTLVHGPQRSANNVTASLARGGVARAARGGSGDSVIFVLHVGLCLSNSSVSRCMPRAAPVDTSMRAALFARACSAADGAFCTARCATLEAAATSLPTAAAPAPPEHAPWPPRRPTSRRLSIFGVRPGLRPDRRSVTEDGLESATDGVADERAPKRVGFLRGHIPKCVVVHPLHFWCPRGPPPSSAASPRTPTMKCARLPQRQQRVGHGLSGRYCRVGGLCTTDPGDSDIIRSVVGTE